MRTFHTVQRALQKWLGLNVTQLVGIIIIMYSMLECMYRQGRLGSAAQLKSTIDLVLRLSNKIHVRGLRAQNHEYQFCGFK